MPRRKVVYKRAFMQGFGPQYYKGVTSRGKRLAGRAKVASKRLIDRLKRENLSNNLARALGAKLMTCSSATPCQSPACPRCAQAAQEQFASIAYKYKRKLRSTVGAKPKRRDTGRLPIQPRPLFAATTIVTGHHASLAGHLGTPSIAQVHRWFTDQLAKAKVKMAIGVLEVTLIGHADDRYPLQWVWHLHSIIETDDLDVSAARLRGVFPSCDMIPRPVKVVRWDGKRRWLRYCYKSDRRCRIGIDALERFNAKKQEKRVCRGTISRRLTPGELLELLLFLDNKNLGDRILTSGSQLRFSNEECKLVKMQRPTRLKRSKLGTPTRKNRVSPRRNRLL